LLELGCQGYPLLFSKGLIKSKWSCVLSDSTRFICSDNAACGVDQFTVILYRKGNALRHVLSGVADKGS
jgi:hypothetical protein